MTYLQALKQLQYWLTNNQASRANHLNFNVHPLSTDELHAIREYTQNKLPESYYLFLQQCGTGDFFYSWYTSVIDQTASQTPKIEIYNLAQLKEQNRYYQQLLREELDDLPPNEQPDIGEIFIIGAHHSMGDWFGFDLSRMLGAVVDSQSRNVAEKQKIRFSLFALPRNIFADRFKTDEAL